MAQTPASPSETADAEPRVWSEDVNAGLATPVMDLIAAVAIGAIALWFTIASLMLPMPGGIVTAPGLLPFLTAGSLLVMAGMLAAMALRRWRSAPQEATRLDLPADFRRSMLLGGILVVYVAALQYLPVEMATRLGPVRLVVGNFEVASLVVLTAVLFIFWKAPLWKCLTVVFCWIAFLSAVFRIVFEVQLP
jgi:hypothetical protein